MGQGRELITLFKIFYGKVIFKFQRSESITNLYNYTNNYTVHNILKSKDITLPTKICLVKAMVFPVVMYGCESWTVKKAER